MRSITALLGVSLVAAPAFAAPDLFVSEIWFGQAGTDVTADWFEVTNQGDMDWDLSANALWYDDVSADPADAALMEGVTTIAPGESVVFVIGGLSDATDFTAAWTLAPGVQVGWTDGAGLGQGGDAVTIFDGPDMLSLNTLADLSYGGGITDAHSWMYNPNNGSYLESIDGFLGAYSSDIAGGDGLDVFAVGSPGLNVPAPAAGLILPGMALAMRRRRSA